MPRPRAADWVDADEALARVLAVVEPLEVERVPLAVAAGRVLAEDVIAPADQPPWDNSGMDGYAVRAADIAGAQPDVPRALAVVEEVAAGAFPTRAVGEGEAIRIMTGAPIPAGADSVVRLEHTRRAGGTVLVERDEDAGRNVRPRGEDLRRGEIAVARGARLDAAHIGVLATVGCVHVPVHRRPVVAILSTGDELVEAADLEAIAAGRRIANSNGPMLAAAVTEAGGEPLLLGIARDDTDDIARRIARALHADALVVTAGASMGDHDLAKDALEQHGFQLAFWRARVRPGSPLAFGTIPRQNARPLAVFSLPGNPVSAFVTCELFVKPALRRMQGRARFRPVIVAARTAERIGGKPGLTRFLRVTLEHAPDGVPRARLTGPQGSGVLTGAARADALLIVPEHVAVLEAGAAARVLLLATADAGAAHGGYNQQGE